MSPQGQPSLNIFDLINSIGHFAGEKNGGDIIGLEHFFMRRHREGHLARSQFFQHTGIHKVCYHNVHVRLRFASLTDDPFHSSDTFTGRMTSVLIIIHRKLDEKQIHLSLGQYLGTQAKSPGGGAS